MERRKPESVLSEGLSSAQWPSLPSQAKLGSHVAGAEALRVRSKLATSEWCPKWVSAVVTGAGVGTHVHCGAGWGDLGRVWDLDCMHYKCHGLLPMPCPDTALGSEPPLSLQQGPSLGLCHPCSGMELYHRQAGHVLAFYMGPDTGYASCISTSNDRPCPT